MASLILGNRNRLALVRREASVWTNADFLDKILHPWEQTSVKF